MAPVAGVGDQVGQVRAGQHRGLIDHQQGARADRDGAAGAAAAGQVAQELGGVVGHRDPGGQGVAGRLGRGDADHRAEPGFGPDPGGLGQHPGLPGPGRRVDHRDEPAIGQRRPARRRPGPRAARCPCAYPARRARPALARRARVRPARPRAAPGPRRAPARPARGSRAARRPRRRARPCVLPWPAARAWHTGCRRAAGRRCARPRAASWPAPRPARVLPGRPPARTPRPAPGQPGPAAARRPRPDPGRCGAGRGPGT